MRLFAGLSCLLILAPCVATADVFDYVAAPDPSYQWEAVDSGVPGLVNLSMTSQTWQGIPWQHTLSIVRPANLKYPDLAVLLITGGSYRAEGKSLTNVGTLLANSIGATVAVLWDIPNQPIWNMKEDDLIAHTFGKTLETGDYTWPLLFPMTKSAVRAMDALTEWSAKTEAPISRFITTGASKRGWTTFFTSVVDPRVVAMMPMVYDNLNIPAQMRHQIELWGHYSPQIDDYTRRGLQAVLDSEAGAKLAEQIDPYTYRDKMTMPKLLLGGTNDAYWTIDALNIYRDELPGQTYQMYVPNAGHGMGDLARVLASCQGFVRLIGSQTPLPPFGWTFTEEPGRLAVRLDAPTAARASVWWATGEGGLFTDATWTELPLTGGADGWTGTVDLPAGKDLACFGDIQVEVDGGAMPLSTPMQFVRGK